MVILRAECTSIFGNHTLQGNHVLKKTRISINTLVFVYRHYTLNCAQTIVHYIKWSSRSLIQNALTRAYINGSIHTSDNSVRGSWKQKPRKQRKIQCGVFCSHFTKTCRSNSQLTWTHVAKQKQRNLRYKNNKRMRIIETETDHPYDVTRVAH